MTNSDEASRTIEGTFKRMIYNKKFRSIIIAEVSFTVYLL